MPYGYNGRVLHVDLGAGRWYVEEPGEIFFRTYWGGGALASCYLHSKLRPGADPLSPGNVLVFAASVLCGAPLAGFNRCTVAAKSPVSGGFGEAEAGGCFGPELKFAGYDAIVLYGRAPHPVYLWICDGAVELKDAQGLWGLETGPALDAIREELGQPEARIASSAACVNSELAHVNDRSAMGAVMGSKNLKAVAVRGEPAKLSFADPAAVQELDARHRKALKERMPGLNPGTCGMPMHGPLGILESPKPLDCGPDKVRWFKAGQLTRAMSSTLGICNFAVRPVFALTYDRLVAVAGALTGWDTSLHELLLGAERAIVLARMFDVREGLTRQDDCLCRRLREALPAVRPAEEGPDEAGFRAALALYYEMMGWDEEGVPRRGKLLDLNLGWLAARGAGSAEKAV